MNFSPDPLAGQCMQSVALRRQVDTIVKQDISEAYRLAKSIVHPWYRCQALATVADNSTGASIRAILQESYDSAMDCHDPNRRVSVACWPMNCAQEQLTRCV
jgi:hypothetical protein